MEINLRNPSSAWAAAATVLIVAVCILVYRIISLRKSLKDKEKKSFRGSSAMWIASELPSYKRRVALYILLKIMGIAGLAMSLLSAAYLMGRPSYNKKIDAGVKRRDIYLCLDVSYSLYELNADFVENLEDVVRGLDGDRVGISIFNTFYKLNEFISFFFSNIFKCFDIAYINFLSIWEYFFITFSGVKLLSKDSELFSKFLTFLWFIC